MHSDDFEHNDVLVVGLYYFDALASIKENEEIYSISGRLLRYTEKENFDKLQIEDAIHISDF
jgi:hypothetical protein